MPIPVVDLFAGPGGLNEGFSSVGESIGLPAFQTVASFEMDTSACNTLTLRGAFRHALRANTPMEPYYAFIRGEISLDELRTAPGFEPAFVESEKEVNKFELGPETRSESDEIIKQALRRHGISGEGKPWVLIGGPPCQAYSLAGRSRRANDKFFDEDKKHFLYREYLHIISEFAPPVFVMENVKGLLSSTNSGDGMFAKIMGDLKIPRPGLEYEIHSLVVRKNDDQYDPGDFVIRAERFGIPQKRHRVILLGIRKSSSIAPKSIGLLSAKAEVTVGDAISKMPPLRSGVSRMSDGEESTWFTIREKASNLYPLKKAQSVSPPRNLSRGAAFVRWQDSLPNAQATYSNWIFDNEIGGVIQHEARTHMKSDLVRYWYSAKTGVDKNTSPRLREYPPEILPNHANAKSELRPFEDRFRVQLTSKPSTTIVSHIAKDGHYYIHPDPHQMRSLTVREAARLQTFPDNYYFCGNRTSQFTQVGNAVPPLLANQIATVVAELFAQLKLRTNESKGL